MITVCSGTAVADTKQRAVVFMVTRGNHLPDELSPGELFGVVEHIRFTRDANVAVSPTNPSSRCVMNFIATGRRLLLGICLTLTISTSAVWAHNPDTSYARFTIGRDQMATRLTYDLVTLLRIAPQLDANRDRRISADELLAQVPVIDTFLRSRIKLEIDGRPVDFGDLQPVAFPAGVGAVIAEKDYHAATSLVHFSFRRSFKTPPTDVWVRFEFFSELGSQQVVLGAFEHDGQEHEVLFREDEPDYLFDTGVNDTAPSATVVPPQPRGEPADSPEPQPAKKSERSNTSASPWRQFASFLRLGIEHIFLGYDHILFLLSLIVVCRFRELIKIVTSFTLAHTITLILATLEVVQLPGRFVETTIAATIVYVAVENFWIKADARRWPLTFVFGLIHGFGFAGVLQTLDLPTTGLVRSLVAFNLGVEVGQVAIVCLLFPISLVVAKSRHGRLAQRLISGVIALCGAGWFFDRAFSLGCMPF